MNKADFFTLIRKNYMLIIICGFALAALLVVGGMFSESDAVKSDGAVSEYKAQLEEKLSYFLCRMKGVGECKVFITLENAGEDVDGTNTRVRGIAVLCTGGANSGVKTDISELLSRALGIQTSRISIGILN